MREQFFSFLHVNLHVDFCYKYVYNLHHYNVTSKTVMHVLRSNYRLSRSYFFKFLLITPFSKLSYRGGKKVSIRFVRGSTYQAVLSSHFGRGEI